MKNRVNNRSQSRILKCVLFLLFMLSASIIQAGLPYVPFPDDANINVVGEHLVVNGLPLMAYEFHSQNSKESITEFYKKEWEKRSVDADSQQPYLETKLAEWVVLSRLEKGHNITVQIKQNGIYGQWVLVGVSPLPTYLIKNKKRTKQYSIPPLGLATILSLVESVDGENRYETYWIESSDSIDVAIHRYEQFFQENRYNVNKKRVLDSGSRETNMALLLANQNQESIRMDIMRIEGKTRMILSRRTGQGDAND